MANTFKIEVLNDNDIKSNTSYEHLKVMLKNKIIQVVSAKSTVFNSKEEIRTYHNSYLLYNLFLAINLIKMIKWIRNMLSAHFFFHHIFTMFSPCFHHIFTMFSPFFNYIFVCALFFHHFFTMFSPFFTIFSPFHLSEPTK